MTDVSEWGVGDWIGFADQGLKIPPLYQQLVTQCNTCGSLIVDGKLHEDWHDAIGDWDE